ncbi:hypothetical protein BJV74DRAFT_868934 [Russula compacta]|nr:hypothetical protein BJV74DRAFT_868934 [Russula compacta]
MMMIIPTRPPHRLPARMVNFHDPVVTLKDNLAVIKLWHVVYGLYIWEYVTTLDFEWNVLRGHRPFRWTIVVYSLTRVSTLISVALSIVGFDGGSRTQHECQAVITSQILFAYLGLAAASLLIVLRIVAIWDRNFTPVAIAATIWIINVSFLVHGISQLRGGWEPIEGICMALNIESTKPNIIVTLITDITLLTVMLLGLLRIRSDGGGRFGLGGLLWRQGVIWILLASIAELPTAVLICLNLNDPLKSLFQFPTLITMSIAATRMHRFLTVFGSGTSEIAQSSDKNNTSGRASANVWNTSDVPIALNRLEVSIHTTCHQSSTSKINHDGHSGKQYTLGVDDPESAERKRDFNSDSPC